MAENKENMGSVTHQISNHDDEVHKSAHVVEANVASVALGEFSRASTVNME